MVKEKLKVDKEAKKAAQPEAEAELKPSKSFMELLKKFKPRPFPWRPKKPGTGSEPIPVPDPIPKPVDK